jgi:hypothetical protein
VKNPTTSTARRLDTGTLAVRLAQAAHRLGTRLGELQARLHEDGVDGWPAYLRTLEVLATIMPVLSAESPGRLLSTAPPGRACHVPNGRSGAARGVCPVCSKDIRPHDVIRRAPEGLTHTPCWMRRYRTTRQSNERQSMSCHPG